MITIVAVVFLGSLIISIIVAGTVNNRLGMYILIFGICLDIFVWGMFGSPVLAYYNFLKDIFTGRIREESGVVKSVNTKPVYKDNRLYYYEVLIDDGETERMLLIDANKPLPAFDIGKRYEFEVYQNYVVNIL
jgi:hypothetical protein